MAIADQFGLLTHLFDNLPLGLIVLDHQGRVVVFNRAEEQLAGRSRHGVLGTHFFTDVAPCMNVQQLAGEFTDRIGRGPLDVSVEMSFPFPHVDRPRDVRVRMCSLDVGGAPFGFLIVEDISLIRAAELMREKLQQLLVHDLKNPLAAVTLNLGMLAELASVRDTPDALEAVEDSLAATRRLNRMTIDLLDLSRLESATMPLRRSRTQVPALLARVVTDNRANARSYRSRVSIRACADVVADLDEDLVIRALDNLVENAIRHARNVTLAATVIDNDLVVEVADDGPGVPRELLERLFDRYVQVQVAGAARGYNRGMGLTFVRLVAREHGGDVTAVCPPGGGTVFTLRMPVIGAA